MSAFMDSILAYESWEELIAWRAAAPHCRGVTAVVPFGRGPGLAALDKWAPAGVTIAGVDPDPMAVGFWSSRTPPRVRVFSPGDVPGTGSGFYPCVVDTLLVVNPPPASVDVVAVAAEAMLVGASRIVVVEPDRAAWFDPLAEVARAALRVGGKRSTGVTTKKCGPYDVSTFEF